MSLNTFRPIDGIIPAGDCAEKYLYASLLSKGSVSNKERALTV